jgi:hypothetical protein
MVAFHPNDFSLMARVRELSDIAQEFPMLFGKPAKVQIAENIAQQDEAIELD